jgi:hypothetical protein
MTFSKEKLADALDNMAMGYMSCKLENVPDSPCLIFAHEHQADAVAEAATEYLKAALSPPVDGWRDIGTVRSPLFRVRGAILAEIDTNPKEANRLYWTERLADLDEAISLLPQPPKEGT